MTIFVRFGRSSCKHDNLIGIGFRSQNVFGKHSISFLISLIDAGAKSSKSSRQTIVPASVSNVIIFTLVFDLEVIWVLIVSILLMKSLKSTGRSASYGPSNNFLLYWIDSLDHAQTSCEVVQSGLSEHFVHISTLSLINVMSNIKFCSAPFLCPTCIELLWHNGGLHGTRGHVGLIVINQQSLSE